MRMLLAASVLTGLVIGIGWPSAETVPPDDAREAVAKPQRTVVERSSRGSFYVTALVNGEPVRFVVDTGAELTALTKADAARARIDFDPSRFEQVARTASGVASGQKIHIASIDLDGKKREDVGGIVLEGLQESLLGQNYLSRLDAVEMIGDKIVLR